MEIIEQIGAYGGLAAVLGLAVLSALYFSQARDVRRLREWAGRAPERVAEGAAADQLARGVVAQPQPKVVQDAQTGAPAVPGAKPATPAGKPVPAVPAAAGAGPATAGQKVGGPTPATPAATPAAAQAADLAKDSDTEEAEKVPATAATPAGAAAAASQSAGAAAGGQAGSPPPTGQAATAAPPRPGDGSAAAPVKPGDPPQPSQPGPAQPSGPATPGAAPASPPKAPSARPGVPSSPARPGARPTVPLPSQRGAPSPSQTAILPPRQAEQPWYRRLLASPRYLVLVIAGVLIVGGAAAFGVVQLTGDDGGTSGEDRPLGGGDAGENAGGDEGDRPRPAPVNPADVTVSVLNGTTIPGLAASIGDRVEANGFALGNVDNSADQGARNESVVMFSPGAEREAIAVGRKLGIDQRESIDAESQAIAGDASVVVITGTDLTQ